MQIFDTDFGLEPCQTSLGVANPLILVAQVRRRLDQLPSSTFSMRARAFRPQGWRMSLSLPCWVSDSARGPVGGLTCVCEHIELVNSPRDCARQSSRDLLDLARYISVVARHTNSMLCDKSRFSKPLPSFLLTSNDPFIC